MPVSMVPVNLTRTRTKRCWQLTKRCWQRARVDALVGIDEYGGSESRSDETGAAHTVDGPIRGRLRFVVRTETRLRELEHTTVRANREGVEEGRLLFYLRVAIFGHFKYSDDRDDRPHRRRLR